MTSPFSEPAYVLCDPTHSIQPDFLDALECLLESTRNGERGGGLLLHVQGCITWLEKNSRHCRASSEAMEEWLEQEVELMSSDFAPRRAQ